MSTKTTKTRVLRIEAEVLVKVNVSFELEVPATFDPDRDTVGITPEVEETARECANERLRDGDFTSTVDDWWVNS